MSYRRAVTTGCILAVTAITLTATTVAAKPQVQIPQAAPSGWKPPPDMLSALQRDLQLTSEQAQIRLLNEARLAPIEARLRSQLGGDFGGSWFTGTVAQTLVVATTDPSDIPQIIAAGAQGELVKRSFSELDTIMNRTDIKLPNHVHGGNVRFIDVRNNRVVVLTPVPLQTEDLIQASDLDASAVRAVESAERPRLLGDIRGGDAYYVGPTSRCSVGFSVTSGTQQGFVSAGHCGKAGDATTGANRADQGVFQGASFPLNDYSWVAVSADWTLKPVVNNASGGTVSVAGSREAIEGASVCRSGSTTDWHCGVIRQRNASVTYARGTVFELTRTSVCAEPGDSGGSFIAVDQAQGVTSGGSGDCDAGGVTYFQPIGEILTTYDLTLVTDNGAIPPEPGVCAAQPKQVIGTLAAGQKAYQPNGRYYRTTVAGSHIGCLDADDGVDFDLHLQRWENRTWTTVMTSEGPNPDERIDYIGPAGFYRFQVVSSNGSSSYKLGYKSP
ncbi:S1 family peptidase [Streptosporangium sp. NBC_01495]|uniref:S1 family peptidase n=1 Tax=Streptosporangium sp. NBC_01495 TaxID=2903899 RepID=UPI002E370D89|nr:S1 family peptidase [Streptosporangium sp. NBC_01495]